MAAVLTLTTALTACGTEAGSGSGEPNFIAVDRAATETTSADASPEETTADKAKPKWNAAYEKVLDNPGAYPVNSAASYDPTGTYTYAIVEATGGGDPELLLSVDSYEYSPVIVFTIGPDGEPVASTDVLIMGLSGAGGSMQRLDAAASGKGLHEVAYHPNHPEFYSTTYVLDGTSLKATTKQTEYPSEAALPDHLSIGWFPTENRDPLRAGELTTMDLSGAEDAAAVPRGESALQAGPGEIAVDGTMLKLTGDEAVNRVGFFYTQPGATYYFFKLDKPTQITGAQGPGTRTAAVEWLFFGGAEAPTDGGGSELVVGKHARLIIDKTQFTFSTEPGFPELAPKVGHATNYEILN